MWLLSGLMYLSLPRCIEPKTLWQHLHEWQRRNRDMLKVLIAADILFSHCLLVNRDSKKQFKQTVNNRWWKWKMPRAWPIWFWDLPVRTVWAYMTNYLSRNKDHKSSCCSILVIWRKKTPWCTALSTVPSQDSFIKGLSSLLAMILTSAPLSIRP